MSNPSRRRILTTGVLGAAGLIATAASQSQATAQTSAIPETAIPNPSGKFQNKVVLITGATSGIGEATARAFAAEGAKVFFCGRRENLGQTVEREIRSLGGEATYLRTDVRKSKRLWMLVSPNMVVWILPLITPEPIIHLTELQTPPFLNSMT